MGIEDLFHGDLKETFEKSHRRVVQLANGLTVANGKEDLPPEFYVVYEPYGVRPETEKQTSKIAARERFPAVMAMMIQVYSRVK